MLRHVPATAQGARALPGRAQGWGGQMAEPRETSGGVWGAPGEAAGTSPGQMSSAALESHPEQGFCMWLSPP